MSLRVIVDPYVALAVLDHYMRRPEPPEPEAGKPAQPDRVTGILLGATVKSDVFVRNWSPSLDLAVIDLIQRSSPAELGVGWYTSEFLPQDVTGTEVEDSNGDVTVKEGFHTVMMKKGIQRPIIVTVSVPNEHSSEVVFRAFQTVNVTLSEGGKPATAMKELPCVVASTDNATNTALDTVVSQMCPEQARASDPARIPASSSSSDNFAELNQMRTNLHQAREYVNDCIAGKREADKATCRAIHELLVTNRVAAVSSSVVNEKLQDMMALTYIAKVLQAQTSVLLGNAPLQVKS